MMNNKKYSRKEFIATLGIIAVAGVLSKFLSAKQVVKAITSKNTNSKNAYGNNTYGGTKKV